MAMGWPDGANMYVYNPANFSVNYANSAGIANALFNTGAPGSLAFYQEQLQVGASLQELITQEVNLDIQE